jgi:hypothetical protein
VNKVAQKERAHEAQFMAFVTLFFVFQAPKFDFQLPAVHLLLSINNNKLPHTRIPTTTHIISSMSTYDYKIAKGIVSDVEKDRMFCVALNTVNGVVCDIHRDCPSFHLS